MAVEPAIEMRLAGMRRGLETASLTEKSRRLGILRRDFVVVWRKWDRLIKAVENAAAEVDRRYKADLGVGYWQEVLKTNQAAREDLEPLLWGLHQAIKEISTHVSRQAAKQALEARPVVRRVAPKAAVEVAASMLTKPQPPLTQVHQIKRQK